MGTQEPRRQFCLLKALASTAQPWVTSELCAPGHSLAHSHADPLLKQSRCQRHSLKDRPSSGGPGCCAQFPWLVNLGEIRTKGPL